MNEAFHQLRAALIARGLITPDYRLTRAGNAYVDALISDLTRHAIARA